mgnify:CR=1 FL=1
MVRQDRWNPRARGGYIVLANKNFYFTSESVSEGHPDKVSDQISDAILDACLKQDSKSRVACETMTTTGLVLVAGEITTSGYVDMAGIAREVINDIGYNDPHLGFDAETAAVLVSIDQQSLDIAQGVNEGAGLHKEQGAGDQGLMFGYACNETDVYMPTPIVYSHLLVEHLAKIRKEGMHDWLRPDSKSQVTVEYRDGKPARVDAVDGALDLEQLRRGGRAFRVARLLRRRVRELLGDTAHEPGVGGREVAFRLPKTHFARSSHLRDK